MFSAYTPSPVAPALVDLTVEVESAHAGLVRVLLDRQAQQQDFTFSETRYVMAVRFKCTGSEAVLQKIKEQLLADLSL